MEYEPQRYLTLPYQEEFDRLDDLVRLAGATVYEIVVDQEDLEGERAEFFHRVEVLNRILDRAVIWVNFFKENFPNLFNFLGRYDVYDALPSNASLEVFCYNVIRWIRNIKVTLLLIKSLSLNWCEEIGDWRRREFNNNPDIKEAFEEFVRWH